MDPEQAKLEIETLVKTCLKLDGTPRKRASEENLKLLGDLCVEHPDIAKEFDIDLPAIPSEPEKEEPVYKSFSEAWLKGDEEIRLLTMQDGSLRQKLTPEQKTRAKALVKKYGGV